MLNQKILDGGWKSILIKTGNQTKQNLLNFGENPAYTNTVIEKLQNLIDLDAEDWGPVKRRLQHVYWPLNLPYELYVSLDQFLTQIKINKNVLVAYTIKQMLYRVQRNAPQAMQ